jgi:hypothetical protein
MAEAHVGELPPGTKPCRVCCEPINEKASRCIHCQSEQAELRYRLGFSGTVLSLLVALASVLAVAVPAIKDVLTPRNSAFRFSYQTITDGSLKILVSNVGIRPGSLREDARLLIRKSNTDSEVRLLHRTSAFPTMAEGIMLIEPGRTYLLGYRVDRATAWDLNKVPDDSCVVEMDYTDFQGNYSEEPLTLPCHIIFFAEERSDK